MASTAASSAREILTGLHEIMAKRGSAQSKLDRVVDLIAEAMGSDVCSIYLLRDNCLELFATHGLRKEAVHVTRLRMGEGGLRARHWYFRWCICNLLPFLNRA